MSLKPDELIDAVTCRETRNELVLVLPDTLEQIGREADVKRPVRLARQ